MTSAFQSRREPQPITRGWEVATALLGGTVVLLTMAAFVGLGVASALFGGGWVWPHGAQTIGQACGGILTGHPARGVPPADGSKVAPTAAVYVCIAACELLTLGVAAGAGLLVGRYRRPNDARRGMATRREAEHALGRSRLREVAAVIRPDLHGDTSRSVHSRRARPQIGDIHPLDADDGQASGPNPPAEGGRT